MKDAALSWQQLYSFPLSHSGGGTRRPEKNRTRRILKEGIVIRGVISLGSPSYHKGICKLRGEIHVSVSLLERTIVSYFAFFIY